MCMTIDKKKTKAFVARDKRKIKVQKLVDVFHDKKSYFVETPFQDVKLDGGWLKAAGDSIIEDYDDGSKLLFGGAIHCYTNQVDILPHGDRFVLNCWAYAEDFIAVGIDGEIAFKKIWVPIEEIEKAIRKYKKRQKCK